MTKWRESWFQHRKHDCVCLQSNLQIAKVNSHCVKIIRFGRIYLTQTVKTVSDDHFYLEFFRFPCARFFPRTLFLAGAVIWLDLLFDCHLWSQVSDFRPTFLMRQYETAHIHQLIFMIAFDSIKILFTAHDLTFSPWWGLLIHQIWYIILMGSVIFFEEIVHTFQTLSKIHSDTVSCLLSLPRMFVY